MTDGQWIRHQRRKRQLSQFKMAGFLGINQAFLSQWELGTKAVPDSDVHRLRMFFLEFDRDQQAGKIDLTKRRFSRDYREDGKSEPQGERASPENRHISPELSFLREGPKGRGLPGRSLTAISLFSGIGGFSLGFKLAGYTILGHVEKDPQLRSIYAANFPDIPCLGHDARELGESCVRSWGERYGHVDVLFGGPPCQGFSLAGKRDRFDPRNELYLEFARIAKIMRPDVVLMENVRLLTSMKNATGVKITEHVTEVFAEAGYRMGYEELNAQDYGVPQFRDRVFFLGIRDGLTTAPITFPPQTHGDARDQNLFTGQLRPRTTFRDATADLEPLEAGAQSTMDPWHFAVSHPKHVLMWLKDVPEGRSAHENTNPDLRPPSGYNTTYKRLKWDEPCSTIGTTFGMISASRNVHPADTRSITVREAARCQTFPDYFIFKGKLGDIRTGIGNAVPPLLAKVLGEHIAKA